jgi:hypothetical protein
MTAPDERSKEQDDAHQNGYECRAGHCVGEVTLLSSNGSHQRPHANESARGREGLVDAERWIARGRALYVSRRAACVC